jgi:hypothetical protein
MLVFCGTTYYHALTADTQFRQDLFFLIRIRI